MAIIITGPAEAGKSAIARKLAKAFSCKQIPKDKLCRLGQSEALALLRTELSKRDIRCVFVENPECCRDLAGRREIGKILASAAKSGKHILLETTDPVIITEFVIEHLKLLNSSAEFELVILYKENKNADAREISVEEYLASGIPAFAKVGEDQFAELDQVLAEKKENSEKRLFNI